MVSEVAAPFGGVKQSGLGREGGPEGLQEYQQLKYLSITGALRLTNHPHDFSVCSPAFAVHLAFDMGTAVPAGSVDSVGENSIG